MFENEISKNKYFGRDEYMNPVVVESKIDIVGQIKNVLISDFSKQTIYGKISKEEKNNRSTQYVNFRKLRAAL